MPVYVLDSVSKQLTHAYERSSTIAWVTDAMGAPETCAGIVEVADRVDSSGLCEEYAWPETTDGIVVFLQGETLLSGNPLSLRHHLLEPARRYFVPVHFPGTLSLDLIGIEPRWERRNAAEEVLAPHWRIASSPQPSAGYAQWLERHNAPWARLSLALLAAGQQPHLGIERLTALLGEPLPQWLAALALRDLILLLWKAERWQDGNALLERGLKLFPAYSELPYLTAVREWSRNQAVATLHWAQQAIEIDRQSGHGSWVGSGGEGTYRAHCLMGTVAGQLGDHRAAFYNYLPGLRCVPPFAESVKGIVAQQVPGPVLEWLHLELRNVARQYPRYREPVIQFLRSHGRGDSARLLMEADGTKNVPLIPMRPVTRHQASSTRRCIQLSGPIFTAGPESRLMRTLSHAILEASAGDGEFRLDNLDFQMDAVISAADREVLTPRLSSSGYGLDLIIRSHDANGFEPPTSGRLVIAAWPQIRAVPVWWPAAIDRHVHRVLAASGMVRDTMLRAGVAGERITLLRPWVNPRVYTPMDSTKVLAGEDFVFLFPASCSFIHGLDVLLDAWDRAFSANDPVALVVWQDTAPGTSGGGLQERVQARTTQGNGPRVHLLQNPLSDPGRAELLRSAEAVVLPFRMEASALAALEAVACGTPVIASRIEPVQEVLDLLGDAVLAVDGVFQPIPIAAESRQRWSEPPLAFEPDGDALVKALHRAFAERAALRCNAQTASSHIHSAFGEPSISRFRAAIEEMLQ